MPILDEIEAAIPALRRYALALSRDRDLADDLVQDCLERALKSRQSWRRDGPVQAWMFRILQNLFRDEMRRRPRRPHLVPVEDVTSSAIGQSGGQEDHLALQAVHDAMGRLPEDQRAALLLVAVEGMTYDQAAKVLSIPRGTLMSRLARARATLRLMTGRSGAADTPPPGAQRAPIKGNGRT